MTNTLQDLLKEPVLISYCLVLDELKEDIGQYIDTRQSKPVTVYFARKNKPLIMLDVKELGYRGIVDYLRKEYNISEVEYF